MERTECQYGRKCYRRNRNHLLEFSHPFVEGIAEKINEGKIEDIVALELDSSVLEQAQVAAELIVSGEMKLVKRTEKTKEATDGPPSKRAKLDGRESVSSGSSSRADCTAQNLDKDAIVSSKIATTSVAGKVDNSALCHYFLSTITGIPDTKNQPCSLTFSDVLDPSLGKLESSVQFNFMVELGWLLAQYCRHKIQRKPLLVIHGEDSEELREAPKLVPTMKTIRVKPKFSFGHHHTKMAILSYEDGSIRVVIHTGNLIESDWENRTQGLWISPKCPSTPDPTDSVTGFRKDLIRYLEAYSLPDLRSWIDKIRQCDMSAIKVCFIPSVPASHQHRDAALWGHPYLASLLKQHATADESDDGEHGHLLMQCSSIGSLGPSAKDWLQGDIGYSMASCHGSKGAQFPSIKVVFPCYQDVASSLDGIHGGGCLPYSKQGHSKQTWLTSFLHQWRSDERLRTRSMPHIKSYARVSQDWKCASWFVLSSANLSKAAWGMKTKSASLMIQSYEAGVLFLPKFVNGLTSFKIGQDIYLPYDLPPTRYKSSDQPWFIDNLR